MWIVSVCQRACRKQWRPSRLESECILGEGINVQFPDARCTVLDQTLAGKLNSFSSYIFSVVSCSPRVLFILGWYFLVLFGWQMRSCSAGEAGKKTISFLQ